jgi:hypothetical protein
MLRIMLLAVSLATAQSAPAPLRIVVIEGEAGVNIIQQKTAVKPVIEVRDGNNLPVAGVLVTFSIEGGKAATFGGASTLTVATNAAGQAAVSSLTPNLAGAFQIHVSAAFQGQIATATIAQTNVVTAAQAAAAGAASGTGSAGSAGGGGTGAASGAGGAAGGAGGGLSATTIAVAGAAVAGGAVAATELAQKGDGGGAVFTGKFSGTIAGTRLSRGGADSCTYTFAVSADARLRFQGSTETSVNGVFDYTGSLSLVSTNCSPTPMLPQFIGEANPLTGSPASFSGRTVIDAAGGNITGGNTHTFQGSINGNTASGTFTYTSHSFSPGEGGGSVTDDASGTFPITFQKQ